jgi:acetyl esterase/lipase
MDQIKRILSGLLTIFFIVACSNLTATPIVVESETSGVPSAVPTAQAPAAPTPLLPATSGIPSAVPTAQAPATPTPLLPATPTYQPTPDMPTPTLSALLDRHLEINVAKDIAYTSEQKMDIYSPITPGDWPIVVVLHGGGSTKSEVQGISQAIAQRGAVVFAPQYRSSEPILPSDTITQGPEDAACAVRFARAKAAGYGTKPTPRLILVGHSGGGAIGMTVMLAGDDFKGDCLINEGSALPDAFVGLDVPYDILSLVSPDNLRKAPMEQWRLMTPFSYVDRKPIRQNVSFYLLCGVEDGARQMGLRMHQALQAAGYPSYLAFLPGVSHTMMASPSTKQVLSVILEAMQ